MVPIRSIAFLFARSLAVLALLEIASTQARAQCLHWEDGFALVTPGIGGNVAYPGVSSLTAYDAGSGPAVYLGGSFQTAGDVAAPGFASWTGSHWIAPAHVLTGNGVYCSTIWDDGDGPELYVAGSLSNVDGVHLDNIGRWNGTAWSNVGQGATGVIYSLGVYDDGSGSALYAGRADNQGHGRINRLKDHVWTDLPGQFDTSIAALAGFDDGSGPALYVAGYFTFIDGTYVNHILRWDGVHWSEPGGGLNGQVRALCVYDDGGGSALYAGGFFTAAGGVAANNIARWDGTSWTAVGGGTNASIQALTTFDDGGGNALVAGGSFTLAGSVSAHHVASWKGASWSAMGNGLHAADGCNSSNYVLCLTKANEGSGAVLYAGGLFQEAEGSAVESIARWDGASWSALGASARGIGGTVNAIAVHDDGSGSALFVAGQFHDAGGSVANSIVKWNGSSWSPLGTGMCGGYYPLGVFALMSFDIGGGPRLYAAGSFSSAGGTSAGNIARWDGSTWTGFGGQASAPIYALAEYDSGSGPSLYAGGQFSTVGPNLYVNGIARWNGTSWSALGSGMNGSVNALATFDDGSGTALYAGGAFNTAGGLTVHYVARWNGSSWSALQSGLSNHAYALLVFDDGTGSALYVGGGFGTAGGVLAKGIARWNGSSWSAVGAGFDGGVVYALGIFDDGTGPALYAGGGFSQSGGVPISGVAKWNGTTWSALGAGMSSSTSHIVRALAAFDRGPGHGAELWAGGEFTTAGANPARHIAQWRGCAGSVETFCFGDGTVARCPCRNSGVAGHGCENSAATGGARLYATGTTIPDRIVLHSTGEIASALSIFLQGDALISSTANFGDGLLCAGGDLVRLYVESAVGGSTLAPEVGDPSITSVSAALGHPIAPGSTRFYQTYYRDPSSTYCPPPEGDRWNVSNGVRVVW